MGWHGWFTLAVIVVALAVLVSERGSPPVIIIAADTTLLLAGVIDSRSALSGFSNEAPITIAALYVVAAAAESAGALEGVTRFLLRPPRPGRDDAAGLPVARFTGPIAALSAFIYNTPLVAMLAPRVARWASQSSRPVSRYLLPLNVAVLLGGIVTAIGTTTNVVISGLLSSSHRTPLRLFEVTPVGLPVCIAGLIVLALGAVRLLPARHSAFADRGADVRDFTVEMVVKQQSPLAGQTISGAGLRNLDGVFLIELRRGGVALPAVDPAEVLTADDRLVFAGNVKRVLDLQRLPGLRSAEHVHFSLAAGGPGRRFYEAVVAPGSALAGNSLRDVGFRNRYESAVVAVHRAGERVAGKLGEITLRPGDVLLVLASGDFRRRWSGTGDFVVVADLDDVPPPPAHREQAIVVNLVVLAFLVCVATGFLTVLAASLVAALLLVFVRVITPSEARQAVDMNVIAVLCGSFGIGEAVGQSGLASATATQLVRLTHGLGDIGILAGVLLATVLITQVVTNNATAVLMYPIALATAAQTHLNERAFVLALVVGASASFLTPIGYQTNLIVYGMGGYRWSDFVRLGLPITVVVVLVSLVAIPVAFPLR